MDLLWLHSERLPQEEVGLADELHIAVFDAVVHHLDEMARALRSDPVAAGRSVIDLGSDRLKDRLHVRPGCRIASRHDRRAFQRPLLAAGDTRADEVKALGFQVALVRRVESGKCEFPPSIRMSPGSSKGTNSSIT